MCAGVCIWAVDGPGAEEWTLAGRAGEVSPDGMQRRLRWADRAVAVVRDLREYVAGHDKCRCSVKCQAEKVTALIPAKASRAAVLGEPTQRHRQRQVKSLDPAAEQLPSMLFVAALLAPAPKAREHGWAACSEVDGVRAGHSEVGGAYRQPRPHLAPPLPSSVCPGQ